MTARAVSVAHCAVFMMQAVLVHRNTNSNDDQLRNQHTVALLQAACAKLFGEVQP